MAVSVTLSDALYATFQPSGDNLARKNTGERTSVVSTAVFRSRRRRISVRWLSSERVWDSHCAGPNTAQWLVRAPWCFLRIGAGGTFGRARKTSAPPD